MLEIDVDVGRLATFRRNETLEQQVDLGRIDRCDAEAIAHDGVGRRAATLGEDAARAGESDDVVDGEEVMRIAERADEGQLALEIAEHFSRHAVREALHDSVADKGLEMGLRRGSRRNGFVRILVAQLIQREAAGGYDLERTCERRLETAEKPRHLASRLQVSLGVGEQQAPGIADDDAFADAGDHIGEGTALQCMEENVSDRDQGNAMAAGQHVERGDARPVVTSIKMAGGER